MENAKVEELDVERRTRRKQKTNLSKKKRLKKFKNKTTKIHRITTRSHV